MYCCPLDFLHKNHAILLLWSTNANCLSKTSHGSQLLPGRRRQPNPPNLCTSLISLSHLAAPNAGTLHSVPCANLGWGILGQIHPHGRYRTQRSPTPAAWCTHRGHCSALAVWLVSGYRSRAIFVGERGERGRRGRRFFMACDRRQGTPGQGMRKGPHLVSLGLPPARNMRRRLYTPHTTGTHWKKGQVRARGGGGGWCVTLTSYVERRRTSKPSLFPNVTPERQNQLHRRKKKTSAYLYLSLASSERQPYTVHVLYTPSFGRKQRDCGKRKATTKGHPHPRKDTRHNSTYPVVPDAQKDPVFPQGVWLVGCCCRPQLASSCPGGRLNQVTFSADYCYGLL